MAGVHSERDHVRAKWMHASTTQISMFKVPGYPVMHVPMGRVRGYLKRTLVQCACRRVDLLCAPLSLYVHLVVPFECSGMSILPTLYCGRGRLTRCWRIRAMWIARYIEQEKQEGC